MFVFLQRFVRTLPVLLAAFVLALAVWISAVTSNDPLEERPYPQSVPIEIIGQDPGLVQTANVPTSVSLVLSAPRSIWTALTTEQGAVRAIVDLSGLTAGVHSVPVQVQIIPRPVRKISQSPQSITVNLERLASQEFEINLVQRGVPAIGYQAEEPTLSRSTVMVTGPQSLVERVIEVRAVIDIGNSVETINQVVPLQALDANDNPITGLTLTPDRVTVNQIISQRFGYRNVVVRVVVIGQIANGYRLTNISVFPPTVTVFSTDPQIVTDLPGFVETEPLDLTNLKDDLDISLRLALPEGVSVVGEQTEVLVRVGVAAIESSLTLPNVPVEFTGQRPGLRAEFSPETVTVILSGPIALLERLRATDVRVIIDLIDLDEGTYQLEPEVEILIPELEVESILPPSIEVTILRGTAGTSAPTPRP